MTTLTAYHIVLKN